MPSKSSSYAVPEEQYTLHETIGRTVVLSHDTNRNKLQQAGHCLCELNHLPRFCEFECVRTLLRPPTLASFSDDADELWSSTHDKRFQFG
ncbi:uncharacterized protein LOC143230066 isoform X1 [Tachypleus tridentatus]|uniref:uncharacterized protein LOC143230066 isoform X1 n=1 Tax=Tachypleus tridentatus TaxID=6853 RepID=UPI003FD42509